MIYTIAEAACQLRISLRAVNRLIGAGDLPVVHLTARRRGVLESDVAAYVARKRVVKCFAGGLPMTATVLKLEKAERAYFAACAQPPAKGRG